MDLLSGFQNPNNSVSMVENQQPVSEQTFEERLKKQVKKQVKKQLGKQAGIVYSTGEEYRRQEQQNMCDNHSRKKTFLDRLGEAILKAVPKVLIAVASIATKAICGFIFNRAKATA